MVSSSSGESEMVIVQVSAGERKGGTIGEDRESKKNRALYKGNQLRGRA